MITVNKPKLIPKILSLKGISENKVNCDLYDINPDSYNNGKDNFNITPAIYNHSSIKKILKKAQHNKCCFCEKLQIDEYAEIEHYRPKLGHKSKRLDKIEKPGYYWQGYVWDNLFFICKPCNVNKGNIFPLEDETKRAKNHRNEISNEKALILIPTGIDIEDPRNHIIFINELIQGVSDEGRATVEACLLDRDDLNTKRRKIIDELWDKILILLASIDDLDNPSAKRAITYLKNSMKKEAEFSAMAIDFINKELPSLIT